jgi:hypothetical protein
MARIHLGLILPLRADPDRDIPHSLRIPKPRISLQHPNTNIRRALLLPTPRDHPIADDEQQFPAIREIGITDRIQCPSYRIVSLAIARDQTQGIQLGTDGRQGDHGRRSGIDHVQRIDLVLGLLEPSVLTPLFREDALPCGVIPSPGPRGHPVGIVNRPICSRWQDRRADHRLRRSRRRGAHPRSEEPGEEACHAEPDQDDGHDHDQGHVEQDRREEAACRAKCNANQLCELASTRLRPVPFKHTGCHLVERPRGIPFRQTLDRPDRLLGVPKQLGSVLSQRRITPRYVPDDGIDRIIGDGRRKELEVRSHVEHLAVDDHVPEQGIDFVPIVADFQ